MTPGSKTSSASADRFRTDARRRGSVLILVLGVSSIVGVIGLSSLLVVRLQHRDVDGRADATQAAILADSGLQVVHAQLSAQSDWRTTHTHDTWTPATNLGNGALRYKLVDEGDDNDGDLADDGNDDARLIVRVAFGDAVRLASIRIAGGDPLGPELVTNGDLEDGTTAYFTYPFGGSVAAYTDYPYIGTTYLQFQNRSLAINGLHQDLDGLIESGKTYRLDAWLRCSAQNESLNIGLYYPDGLTPQFVSVSGTIDRFQWTQLSGDVTPVFSNASSMVFFLSSEYSDQDLHLGQLSIREVLSQALPLIRGSYRRELDR